ncbi:MAG: response regulator [bacterium]
MKIKHKLLSAFLVISLMIAFISYISLIIQGKMADNFQKISGKNLTGAIVLSKIEKELYHSIIFANKYALTGALKDKEEAERALMSFKDYKEAHKLYHHEHITKADEILEEVASLIKKYIELKDGGGTDRKLEQVKIMIDEKVQEFPYLVTPDIDGHVKEAEDAVIKMRQDIINSRRLLIGPSVASFIIALIMAFFISHLISRPIAGLQKGIEGIASGSLDYKIGVYSNDEIGQLSRVFDLMTERLKTTTTSIDRLNKEITERKKKEEEIRELKQQTEFILGATRTGIDIIDSQFNIRYIDPEWAKVYGDPNEKKCYDYFMDRQEPCLNCGIVKALETKQSMFTEENLVKEDNRPIEVTTIPFQDEKGEWLVAEINVDIAKRKKIENALRESESRLFSTLKSIGDAVITTDLEGKVVLMNSVAESLTGWRIEEAKGFPLEKMFKVINEYTREDIENPVSKVLTEKKIIDLANHSILISRDGTEWPIEDSAAPITTSGGDIIGVVLVFRNVTEKRQKERSLEKAIKDAELATIAKSQFLATVSHEIRTPMNAIIGFTDLLSETPLNRDQTEFVESVLDSANCLLALVNDILDFSKIEAGKLDFKAIDFDLRTTVEDIIEIEAIKARDKGLTIVSLIHSNCPLIAHGDPGRLRQVIINLVNNAIKFTSAGEVVLSLEVEKETEEDATLLFKITDTGIGITDQDQEKLFKPFSQVDSSNTRSYGGTGLGLAISKKLVELMAGQIGVQSESGKGSTFLFTVVLKKQKEPSHLNTFPKVDIKGLRVLIVDDSALNRQIFSYYLNSWGCISDQATNGEQAIEILHSLANTPNAYQIVLVDYQMPRMDGFQLAREISLNKMLANTKLILLTSIADRGDVIKVKQAGFSGYLTKPVRQAYLFECLAMVMGLSSGSNNEDGKEKGVVKKDGILITRHTISEEIRKKICLLLVEDNPVNKKIAMRMINSFSYSCDVVNNGLEALEALSKSSYNLILMDCEMPRMNGFEATKEIRKLEGTKKHTPIIAMTAYAMKGDKERCLEVGMDDYIAKPLRKEDLRAMLEKWLIKTLTSK